MENHGNIKKNDAENVNLQSTGKEDQKTDVFIEKSSLISLQNKITKLIEIMMEILPIEKIKIHPFDFYREEMKKIEEVFDVTAEKINKIRKELKVKIADKENEINKLKVEIGGNEKNTVETNKFINYNALNLFLEEENEKNTEETNKFINCNALNLFLGEEIKRLQNKKVFLENENSSLKEEIEKYASLLKISKNYKFTDFPSLFDLSAFLKNEKNLLKSELHKREGLRDYFYEEIEKLAKVLGVANRFTHNETIDELEKVHEGFLQRVEKNKQSCLSLTASIQEKQEVLCEFIQQLNIEFEPVFTDEYVSNLIEQYRLLEEEEKKRIPDIFEKYKLSFTQILQETRKEENKIREYLQLNSEFEILLNKEEIETADSLINKPNEIVLNSTVLKNIKLQTANLIPKKEILINIRDLLERRAKLLNSMAEFEEVASDPKRLFKSSFQLNQEERFRKTALPTLLKLEGELFKQLELYESELEQLKLYLKTEIEKRVINKSVFRIIKRKK
ncbi:hypothetical protein NUSPORA_00978 [Nucleospora cyclopteri]